MTSEKAYRIVLAGDAAVGKSSFLLRLCKNEFKLNSSATLGESGADVAQVFICFILCRSPLKGPESGTKPNVALASDNQLTLARLAQRLILPSSPDIL